MARDALQNRTLGVPVAAADNARRRRCHGTVNGAVIVTNGSVVRRGPGSGALSKAPAWAVGRAVAEGAAYWPTASIGAECSLRGLPTQAAAVAVDEMNDHVYISGQIAGGYEQGSVRFGSRRRCYVSYQPRKAANATQSCAIDGVAWQHAEAAKCMPCRPISAIAEAAP